MNLAEIKAAAEAATPGPWDDPSWQALIPVVYEDGGDEGLAEAQANSAFIAQARTAVPWLIERVEALEEALGDLIGAALGRVPGDDAIWSGVIDDARAALARLEDSP